MSHYAEEYHLDIAAGRDPDTPLKKSIKKLGITQEQAELLYGLIANKVQVEGDKRFPLTNQWIESCFTRPSADDIALSAISEALNARGFESYRRVGSLVPICLYADRGMGRDVPTIFYDVDTERFSVDTQAAVVERLTRKGILLATRNVRRYESFKEYIGDEVFEATEKQVSSLNKLLARMETLPDSISLSTRRQDGKDVADALVVRFPFITVGIEPDGYAHS